MKRSEQGFTLIELLVAMAILALVSVMAVQSLSGALFQRRVMTRVDDDATQLSRALALLRHDLEAIVPLAQRDGAGDALPAVATSTDGFSLMRGGIWALPGEVSDGFARVEWVLETDGSLTRQLRPNGASDDTASPPVVLLDDVSGLTLAPLGGDMPEIEKPDLMPMGFAVNFTHARYGAIRLVVAR